jgi:hypothetical protein
VATTDATVTIDFLAPITNSEDYPVGGEIEITNQTGSFVGAVVEISSVNNETGQIVISIDAIAAPAVANSFTLTHVLVSLLDVATNNLRATVSVSPGDNISVIANQDEATVISTIRAGLGDIEVGEGPARWLATGDALTPDTAGFTVEVEEGYIDSFRALGDAPDGSSNPVMIAFVFGGIPDGAEIECSATIEGGDYDGDPDTDDDPLPLLLGLDQTDYAGGFETEATVDADDSTVYVAISDPLADLEAVETVVLDCGEDGTGDGFAVEDAELPLSGDITVQVTLAPTGDALDDDEVLDDEDDGGEIPRYEEELSDEIIVLSFTPATTTFIVPLAIATPVTPAPLGSYDTGIAIANTTADPFDDDDGGAFGQDGTITFYFFPTTGDTFTVTPAQLAGSCGLDADGELPTGRTFICNTSEILREGGRTTAFTGYVFIVANFTHGHGTAFIYGGTPQERFTSATDVLVINAPSVVPRIESPEPTTK